MLKELIQRFYIEWAFSSLFSIYVIVFFQSIIVRGETHTHLFGSERKANHYHSPSDLRVTAQDTVFRPFPQMQWDSSFFSTGTAEKAGESSSSMLTCSPYPPTSLRKNTGRGSVTGDWSSKGQCPLIERLWEIVQTGDILSNTS